MIDRTSGEDLGEGRTSKRPVHTYQLDERRIDHEAKAIDEREGAVMVDNLQRLVEINNQFYPGKPLSLSVGAATARPGERLEEAVKRADLLMFEAKRAYYSSEAYDRRRSGTIGS